MIDTHLPGDPASVSAMADWLLRTLRPGADAAAEDVVRARRWSSGIWEGESGEAYRGFVRDVVRASDQASADVLHAEDVFRQCASRMRGTQRTLESCRERALAGGLVVLSRSIVPPLPVDAPGPAPANAPVRAVEQWNEQQEAFEEQQRKAELYRQLKGEAEAARREYAEWCENTLEPAARKSGDPSLSGRLLSGLWKAAELTLKFQLSYPAKKLSVEVAHLQRESLKARGELQGLRTDRRSGDPRRRGPANKVDLEGKRQEKAALERLLRNAQRNPVKWLPWLNRAWGLYRAGKDIADGDSPGKVSSKYAGTLGGSAAVVAMVAGSPVTVPTATAVSLGILAGLGGSWAGEQVWRALPEGVREDIDAGLKNSWGRGTKLLRGDIAGVAVDGAKVWRGVLP